MPKNYGRIVSIFSSHKDRCPSFYHSDLHAKFQPIPTGAIREIAPLGVGGKSQLSVTKPAGPLPRRLYETIWRCHARPPRGAGVPPNQELPLSHSILPFVLLTSHYLLPLNVQIKKPTKTRSRRRLGEASNSSTQEIEKLFRDEACQLEPFRIGVRRNSIDGSSSIDYRRNCLAGDKPLRQFLFGLKLRK